MAGRKGTPKALSDDARRAKNEKIRQSALATRTRRSAMDCKVYTVKIAKNRLSNAQKESLERLFLEAKWVRNALISSGDFTRDNLKNMRESVLVKTPWGVESRDVTVLGGQLAQGVLAEIKTNLKQLSSLKKRGKKVGKLRYSSRVTSVDFVQHSVSWKMNKSKRKVKLANIPGWIKVHGLAQLPDDSEYANAKLVKRDSGYFLKVTTFVPVRKKSYESGTVIGIDMGVKDGLTFSDGTKITALFEEPERVKRLRKKLNRQVKGSNKYRKTWSLINREMEKLSYKKNDAAQKIVHELKKNEYIFFQDENISSWRKKDSVARGSKKIHSGILGRVKAQLKNCERAMCLDKSVPTTQLCVCGKRNKIPLSQRIYRCECGYEEDRDVHSALNMIRLGMSLEESSPTLGQSRTPVEFRVRPAQMSFVNVCAGSGTVKREAARSLA